VDQREWDYGARLPRDRRASDPWSTQLSPENPESTNSGEIVPKWQSITDTGSMEPSPEAIAWAQRAEQWAQQPAPPEQQAGQWIEPVSRWSRVAPTGDFPADGVGWRTETAEWRATAARWRQTTEWRSSSGTHGWRSTTEAWQTGDANAEGFPPPAAPPTGGRLSISGTAWSETGDQAPSMQDTGQPPDGSYRTERYTPPTTPGQQQGDGRPAWQQFAAPPSPPWQQPAPAPPWQQDAAPSWQQGAPGGPAGPQPPAGGAVPSWQHPVEPGQDRGAGWQSPFDDGRHLVREDDRAQWRQSAAGMAGTQDLEERTRPIGRRRAPDGGGTGPSTGTGWSTRSDADNWAGHTDTGSMSLLPDPAVVDGSAWRDRTDADGPDGRTRTGTPTWRPDPDAAGRRSRDAGTDAPSWRRDEEAPGRRTETSAHTEAPDWRTAAREDTGDWRSSSWRAGGATDGRRDADASDWRTRADTSWRQEQDGSDGPGRRRQSPSEGRAAVEAPSRRQDRSRDDWRREPDSGSWSRGEEPRTDGWRRSGETDLPSRRRDEPATDPWVQSAADTGIIPASWEQPATDTESWRSPQEAEPYSPSRRPDPDADPYGRRAGAERHPYRRGDEDDGYDDEYGRGGTDPYGRRAQVEAWPSYPPRRAELEAEPADDDWRGRRRGAAEPDDQDGGAPVDPELWQRDAEPRPERAIWRTAPPDDTRTQQWRRELQEDQLPTGEAATEADWQQDERDAVARGTASYREGNTGDWRRELAAQSGLTDGESKRYGTSDFVPFRPLGSASAGTASVPAPRPARDQRAGAREELVVGNGTGAGRRQDPLDTQWPPRPVAAYEGPGTGTGSYERRPVSTLPAASGRQNNLLEPDDDEIEENTGGPLAAVGYTIIWYGVPVVLFVLYMLVLNGSQQAHALSTLAGAAPQFGLSLLLSMVVAVALRWASGSWKAASVGLAAAVMGGGLATVLTSAITGNSLS
jgi:hypothetical protein